MSQFKQLKNNIYKATKFAFRLIESINSTSDKSIYSSRGGLELAISSTISFLYTRAIVIITTILLSGYLTS